MLVYYTHLVMTELLDRPAINLHSYVTQCYFTVTKLLSLLVTPITGQIAVKDRIFNSYS